MEIRLLGPLEVRDGATGHRCRAASSGHSSPRWHYGPERSSPPTGSSPISGARARRVRDRLASEHRPCAAQAARSGRSSSRNRPATGSREPAKTSMRIASNACSRRTGRRSPRPSGLRCCAKRLALWRGPGARGPRRGGLRRAREPRGSTSCASSRWRIGIDAELLLGRHTELVGELEALVAAHPLRDRLRGQLMLALYRCGRQAEALEVYRAARLALADELGLDPSPELQELRATDTASGSGDCFAGRGRATRCARRGEAELRLVTVLAATPPVDDDPETLRRRLGRGARHGSRRARPLRRGARAIRPRRARRRLRRRHPSR